MKEDGSLLHITLLRSLEWLGETQPGDIINLDLAELGAEGAALVCAVGPCPEIEKREGQVVTGSFIHEQASILDIQIAGEPEPIGTTPTPPFFSRDRQEFVPAEDLHVGEHLQREDGSPLTVLSITPRATQHRVFNLEVNLEHVYHVGRTGILVHNVYPDAQRSTAAGRPSARESELDVNGLNPRHRPQVSFRNGREVTYGSRGSVRPDNYRIGEALEVKNNDLLQPANRANLYNTVHRQYLQRISNLPKGTHQRIIIDIRGQNVPESILMSVRRNIQTITRTPDVTVEFLR